MTADQLDLDGLEVLARARIERGLSTGTDTPENRLRCRAASEFTRAVTPATILSLITRLRASEAATAAAVERAERAESELSARCTFDNRLRP